MPHARLVCVHLRALLFLVALVTLTAITLVILTPTIPRVNGKSTSRVQKNPVECMLSHVAFHARDSRWERLVQDLDGAVNTADFATIEGAADRGPS